MLFAILCHLIYVKTNLFYTLFTWIIITPYFISHTQNYSFILLRSNNDWKLWSFLLWRENFKSSGIEINGFGYFVVSCKILVLKNEITTKLNGMPYNSFFILMTSGGWVLDFARIDAFEIVVEMVSNYFADGFAKIVKNFQLYHWFPICTDGPEMIDVLTPDYLCTYKICSRFKSSFRESVSIHSSSSTFEIIYFVIVIL